LSDIEVVVLGGGPAGAAAAITAAQAGLRAVLVYEPDLSRKLVSDAVHPGVEPLLTKLGVAGCIEQQDFPRYAGHWVTWDSGPKFVPFGSDHRGPWLGWHLWRPSFDDVLRAHARTLNVELREERCIDVIVERGRVSGVRTTHGEIRSQFLIDATGRGRFLSRRLGLGDLFASPRLRANFGLAQGKNPTGDPGPAFTVSSDGWKWVACVRPHLYSWIRLTWSSSLIRINPIPTEFSGLRALAPARGADVTWRLVKEPAGDGYFIVGDAAVTVDPACSHGVLRALMTGIMGGFASAKVLRSAVSPGIAAHNYTDWLSKWFDDDVGQLRNLYARAPKPPEWV
jgi:flavin-dependent dehydrogenase